MKCLLTSYIKELFRVKVNQAIKWYKYIFAANVMNFHCISYRIICNLLYLLLKLYTQDFICYGIELLSNCRGKFYSKMKKKMVSVRDLL